PGRPAGHRRGHRDRAPLAQQTPSGTTRVVVVGGRVLRSTASPRGGNCRYSLTAVDPASGRTVWQRDGYDLGTASGAGCEQRRDPGGGGDALAAIRGDNRPVFLSARDGRELWTGGLDPHASVAVTRNAVLVTSAAIGRLAALEPGSGRTLVNVESTATVLGVGADGLVVGRGRTIGYVTFGTVGTG